MANQLANVERLRIPYDTVSLVKKTLNQNTVDNILISFLSGFRLCNFPPHC